MPNDASPIDAPALHALLGFRRPVPVTPAATPAPDQASPPPPNPAGTKTP